MIPLRDTVPSRTHPVVNNLIIGINIVVFMVEIAQGAGLERFVYIYGLVPARYSVPRIASYFTMQQQVFSMLSFMFLHGGFWHLLSNMWFLYIFGNNVEDRLGHLRYIFFYLLCGLASGLVHLLLNLDLNVPTIGASGAIAGVMGAYFILYPAARILTLIPIFFIPYFIEIPAFFFLGFWLIMQILQAAGADAHVSGIAWWAHIGGFVFGIIFLKIFLVLPSTGVTEKVRRVTERKKTHRLQVIHPTGPGDDPHLYGIIVITSYEASTGTRKLVNIPWGFHSRLYRVLVPPDTKEGDMLKLKGLGKQMPDVQTGDLFLKVAIRNE